MVFSIQRCRATHQRQAAVDILLLLMESCSTDVSVLTPRTPCASLPACFVTGALDGENRSKSPPWNIPLWFSLSHLCWQDTSHSSQSPPSSGELQESKSKTTPEAQLLPLCLVWFGWLCSCRATNKCKESLHPEVKCFLSPSWGFRFKTIWMYRITSVFYSKF